jgi:hypothetical protein
MIQSNHLEKLFAVSECPKDLGSREGVVKEEHHGRHTLIYLYRYIQIS